MAQALERQATPARNTMAWDKPAQTDDSREKLLL
jgi:hypothetical protein